MQLEGRSVERIPPQLTLTFDLPKFNHLVPVAKGMIDEVWWQSDLNWRQEVVPSYFCSQCHSRPNVNIYSHSVPVKFTNTIKSFYFWLGQFPYFNTHCYVVTCQAACSAVITKINIPIPLTADKNDSHFRPHSRVKDFSSLVRRNWCKLRIAPWWCEQSGLLRFIYMQLRVCCSIPLTVSSVVVFRKLVHWLVNNMLCNLSFGSTDRGADSEARCHV